MATALLTVTIPVKTNSENLSQLSWDIESLIESFYYDFVSDKVTVDVTDLVEDDDELWSEDD